MTTHRATVWCLLPLLIIVGNAQAQTAVPCYGGDEPFTAETLPAVDLDSGRPCRLPTAAERAAHRGDYPPGSAEVDPGYGAAAAPAARGWNGQGASNASRNGSNGSSPGFGGSGSGGMQGGTFGNKNGSQRGSSGFGNSGGNSNVGTSTFPTNSYGTAPTTPTAPTGYESYGGASGEATGYESYAAPSN